MANISTAYGELTIIAECDKKKFGEFQTALSKYLQRGEYGADFYETDKFQFENGKCETTVGFHGWGRWTFDENLKRFGVWAKNSGCEELSKIKGISFKLIFDFVDCEEGMETLYTEKASIEHKANEPWEKSQYREIECETLAFTADNLIAYGIEDSVIEVRNVEELRDFLKECTEADSLSESDLKRYVSDHYGEMLYDWAALDVLNEMRGY